jgi:dipeptidyl aminopeptidase/acylaminoacyl peptidase
MTAMDRFERRIPELLTDLSGPQVPDYLDDLLSQTAHMRQRPAWTSLERWLPMDIAARAPVGMRRVPWRTIIALALIGALLAIAFAVVGSRQPRPAPFGPSRNGALLYDRGGDIYSADATGANETLLVGGDTFDTGPLWSNDGTQFAFLRGPSATQQLIMAADADGSHVRTLAGPVAKQDWWDWSPDGAQAALYYEVAGKPTLAILDARGSGGLRPLSLGQIEALPFVAWRPPSGAELIILGRPGGDPTQIAMYAIHPDGTGLHQIVAKGNQGDPTQPGPGDVSYQDLQLSPDGSKIAYWNWETRAGITGSYTHVLDVASGNDRLLTGDPKDPSGEADVPKFSPDGKSIVVDGNRLIVEPSDGSQPGVAIGPPFNGAQGFSFSFSPDGAKVILTFAAPGKTWIVDAKTGIAEEAKQAFQAVPSWQRLAP